jgi:hypothetical protein
MPPWPYWYYCDEPDGYYPYVKTCTHNWAAIPISPPPPATEAPISFASWSWCDDPKGYFPYVANCSVGWKSVPVTAPSSEAIPESPPSAANWFYCDAPKGYMPYVSVCTKDWRAVPSVPPPNAGHGTKQNSKPQPGVLTPPSK